MGFVQGAVAILSRTHHLNPSGCHIPELSIHNSDGETVLISSSSLSLTFMPSPHTFPSPGLTPLHVAANSGSCDVLEHVWSSKPDVNLQDAKSGKTALHYAVERQDLIMTDYLITEVCGVWDCNVSVHVCCFLF